MSQLKVHDKFVDQLFSDRKNLVDLIKGYFPPHLKEQLDLSTVRLKKDKITSTDYNQYYLDFIVTAMLNGRWVELYFIIEHKSYPDKGSLIQVLSYSVVKYQEDMNKHGQLRPIVPVILYHGRTGWNLPWNFGDYFDVPEPYKKYMLQFEYVLIDLSKIDDQELLMKLEENARLYAALYALKHIFSELNKFRVLLWKLMDIDKETIEFIINYVVRAREGSKDKMEKILKEVSMPTIAEQWIEEGFKEGLQKGIEEGKKIGLNEGREIGFREGSLLEAQEKVVEALQERFGMISGSTVQKIKQINTRELVNGLFRIALRVDSLEQFEVELKKALQ
jgi:predicted transposase/invertase (TIGR01784 family)